jgi:hypothetical protein
MADPAEDLIGEFIAWLAPGSRPYHEVMEVWRTSCPRLTIWEDALDRRLVTRGRDVAGRPCISVTEAGNAFLATR